MSLSLKERELVNVGASVATGCKPCTDYHFEKVRGAGASDDEIKQAITDAIAVRDSAQEIMESHGLRHLGLVREGEDGAPEFETTRIKELVSIGAAFAVNCTTNLERHLDASRKVGVDEEEIASILSAVEFIKGEAAHYAAQLVQLEQKYDQLRRLLAELRETQAQLVQAEKVAALGKLVAGVVHEMNTPIGCLISAIDVSSRAISNIMDVLSTSASLDEAMSSPRLRSSLEVLENNTPVARTACERITTILDSLKSFIRLDEATLQQRDIHEGLNSTLTLLEPELGDRIEIVKRYGEVPPLLCDPADLNQVFMNLLTNAVEAIEGEGTITVRTRVDDGNIRVAISDTGVGISREQMEGLFDPAFTKKGERVRAGMGLLVASNIVRNHHGRIDVESEPNRGSTFTVVLPTDAEPVTPEVPEIKAQTATGSRCDRVSEAYDRRKPVETATAHRYEPGQRDLDPSG